MNQDHPSLSFIAIVDFSEHAKWLYLTASVIDLLGYEPRELIGRSSLELVHPDEFPRTKKLHYDTIRADQAAAVVYLRMKHKIPSKGYVLCAVSRTVVHNVLVGSVSFANPTKAMHNASTAQEVTVLVPAALNLGFRRWHDPPPVNASIPGSGSVPNANIMTRANSRSTPSPQPHSPHTPGSASSHPSSNTWRPSQSPQAISPATSTSTPLSRSRSISSNTGSEGEGPSQTLHRGDPGSGPHGPFTFPDTDNPGGPSGGSGPSGGGGSGPQAGPGPGTPERPFTFAHLPNQSLRTLFILDRFSRQCPILYCSNDLLVTTLHVMGRSFFDFVSQKDEPRVRTFLEQVKTWGVNDLGEPSDGGFGYGGFELLTQGRDSSTERMPDPVGVSPKRHRERNGDRQGGAGGGGEGGTGRRMSVHSKRGKTGHGGDPYSHPHPHPHNHPHTHTHGRDPMHESIAHGGIQLPPLTGLGGGIGGGSPRIAVDAIFSAHSDGLMVVLRRSVDG